MRKLICPVLTLFAAVAVFTGCTQNNVETNTAAVGSDSVRVSNNVVSASIVYVNTDTLISKYDLYVELSEALQEKSSKVEANLTSRGRNLERDIMNYQEQVSKGLVTRLQAQNLEEELNKKQQDFINYRDQVVNELAEEEAVMFNRIQHNLTEFLKEFNADGRYDMILSTSTGAPVLIANSSLDITKEVLDGMNRKYAESKN
ncbi:MAG: OmpH family outer membrane protein [Rikenellaceae bacterium]|nr:OmpH family outer membrane protein [Rikenellaceae bacterium]